MSDEDVAGVDVLGALPISLPIVPTDAAVPLKAAATDMTLELQLSREPAAARVAMLAADSQAATDLSAAQPTDSAELRTRIRCSVVAAGAERNAAASACCDGQRINAFTSCAYARGQRRLGR